MTESQGGTPEENIESQGGTPEEKIESTPTAATQTDGPAVGGDGDPVASGDENGGKSKAAAVAAGTGAAVAGIAGGIAVAARDTRRRVLGVPVGKRNRFQRGASAVLDRVTEPAKKIGSRFSRE